MYVPVIWSFSKTQLYPPNSNRLILGNSNKTNVFFLSRQCDTDLSCGPPAFRNTAQFEQNSKRFFYLDNVIKTWVAQNCTIRKNPLENFRSVGIKSGRRLLACLSLIHTENVAGEKCWTRVITGGPTEPCIWIEQIKFSLFSRVALSIAWSASASVRGPPTTWFPHPLLGIYPHSGLETPFPIGYPLQVGDTHPSVTRDPASGGGFPPWFLFSAGRECNAGHHSGFAVHFSWLGIHCQTRVFWCRVSRERSRIFVRGPQWSVNTRGAWA